MSNLVRPEAFTFLLGLNFLAPIFDAGRRDALAALVDLFKALGGGWQPQP